MNIEDLLNSNCLEWVRYSDYEYVSDEKGALYIKPTEDSIVKMYEPTPVLTDMTTEALNIGYASKLCLFDKVKLQEKVLNFVRKYGLLGLINAFVVGGDYSQNERVEFKNINYFSKQSLKTKDYIKKFSQFGDLNNAEKDKNVLTVTTLIERPLSYIFIFSKEYSEKYEWVLSAFEKLADVFNTSDQNRKEEFEFSDLSFSLKKGQNPRLVWNIGSLPQAMEIALSLSLVSPTLLLRSCKHCHSFFFTKVAKAQFCSPRCKNQFNVYKSREIHGR